MRSISAILAGTIVGVAILAATSTTEAQPIVDPYLRDGAPAADYDHPEARIIWCQNQYLTITFQTQHPDEDGDSWYDECVSFLGEGQ